MFAAVRHPDVAEAGVCPQGALEYQRAHGWYRVSPWFNEPADIHLPDYAESDEDLDAPEPEAPALAEPDENEE